MKKIFLALLLQMALIACDNSNADKDKDKDDDKENVKDKDKDKDKDNGDDEDNDDNDGPNDDDENDQSSGDQGDPAAVVNSLIAAAKSGNYSALSGFCHEDADSDGDVKRICDLKNGTSDEKQEFKAFFGNAKIQGKAQIEGSNAAVNISYNADGEDGEETINLVKVGGKWYLSGF